MVKHRDTFLFLPSTLTPKQATVSLKIHADERFGFCGAAIDEVGNICRVTNNGNELGREQNDADNSEISEHRKNSQ